MTVYDKIFKLDRNYGIWRYTKRLRVTYVAQCWLVVWDHEQSPPTRHDCQATTHDDACTLAANKLRELSIA